MQKYVVNDLKSIIDAINNEMGSGPILDPARFTTTANITLSGLGVQGGGDWSSALTAGDRILVKNQTNAFDNGVYVAAAGAWSRATDMDESAEVVAGMIISVAEGASDADTVWELSANAPITIGVTNLTFIQIGASEIEIGATPITSGTVGAIIFEGSGNIVQQDATKLFWDNTNNRLGVGTNSPSATGHFLGSGTTSSTYGLQIHNSTGSNNALVVRDDGNVGMNTTTPSAKLHVVGSGATSATYGLKVDNSTGSNNALVVRDDGNVGMNTTTPSAKLHVVGSGATSATYGLKVDNSTGSNNALVVRDDGNVGMNTTTPSAKLHVVGSGNTSATYGLKVDNSTGSNNAFVVRDDGFIGIGTSSPSERLHIYEGRFLLETSNSGNSLKVKQRDSTLSSVIAVFNNDESTTFSIRVYGTATPYPNLALISSGHGKDTVVDIGSSPVGTWSVRNSDLTTYYHSIISTGDMGVGTIGVSGTRLTVKSSGNTSATYALKIDNSSSNPLLYVRDDGRIGVGVSSPSSTLDILQSAESSGTPKAFYLTGGAHTSMTASTEDIGADFNFSATKQWATGAITTQREILIQAPTYSFVGASTITNAATFAISGSPISGTNATITNSYSFWIQGGASNFDGRVLESQGADVASANDLTLGSDGNCFEITGTTQINAITITGWKNGAIITLLFASTPTVKHNTSGGANTAVILLAGAADFSATAGDTLTLRLSEIGGTQAWREIGRAVI